MKKCVLIRKVHLTTRVYGNNIKQNNNVDRHTAYCRPGTEGVNIFGSFSTQTSLVVVRTRYGGVMYNAMQQKILHY